MFGIAWYILVHELYVSTVYVYVNIILNLILELFLEILFDWFTLTYK